MLVRMWMIGLVGACTTGGAPCADEGACDADSAADTSADADTDSDADADSDANTDTDSDLDPSFCDEALDTGAPTACETATLACGDTIDATTLGGAAATDGDAYLAWYCTPFPEDYAGPERVFALPVDRRMRVTATLESPCEDMDLFVANWHDDACPTAANNVLECEAGEAAGDESVVWYGFEGDRYLLFVESKSGAAANFRLTISCEG